jgi:hypothetical protein
MLMSDRLSPVTLMRLRNGLLMRFLITNFRIMG